jgi:hypothetical protein
MQTNLGHYYNRNKKKVEILTKGSNKTLKTLKTDKTDKTFDQRKKNMTEIEEMLIKFDLDLKYGPSKGITRSKRYDLALKYDLNPPGGIKKLIEETKSEKSFYDKFV